MTKDGDVLHGTLSDPEEFWTGEDEVPVYTVILDDGRNTSLFDFKSWRFA